MSAVNRPVQMYRRLLRLYPKQFRDEYAEDMIFVFEEMLRDLPARRVWGRTLRDATSSIVTQRLETPMSKNSLATSFTFAVASLATLVTGVVYGRARVSFLLFVGIAFALGAVALITRDSGRAYREPSDQIDRYWLRTAGAGVILLVAVNVGTGLDLSVPWLVLFSSIIVAILLIAIGAVLGAWRAVRRLRTA